MGEASARKAIVAERLRIAGELHDVVAHSVTVMVLRSAGGQRIVSTNPSRAAEAFRCIETTGKQSRLNYGECFRPCKPATGP